MKNKILVEVYVPNIDYSFELFLPFNITIAHALNIILKNVAMLSNINLNIEGQHYLLNPDTGILYAYSQIIRDTDIRNNKRIVLL